MRAKNISVALVGSGETLRVWNASFEFSGLCLPKFPDGRVNERVRQLLEKKIVQALASLDFELVGPSEDQKVFDAIAAFGGDPPNWVPAPNLPGVEVHPENVSDIDRMLALEKKP